MVLGVLLLVLTLTPRVRAEESIAPVRVMSFNVRYGTARDGDNHWDKRKELLVETIQQFAPDLLGTQETLTFQRDYIREKLQYLEAFGVGRDDGMDAGEMAALFYNRERFEKVEGGNFWLSPTPNEVGSKGWDAALPRIATWVKLIDKKAPGSKPILYVNTHFDHRGKVARAESAKLIRSKLAELGDGHRLLVTGDFNAGAGSEPYTNLLGDPADSKSLQDTYRVSQSPLPDSDEGTFCNFDLKNTKGDRIDWIATSKDWVVRSARIDRNSRLDRTPSDHFPITAVLSFADPKDTLRILSYNIHHARGLDDRVDLFRIAKVIRDSDADIVALQEVDQNVKRSGSLDQAAEIARQTEMYHVFGKAIDLEGGAYGQALLSRYPISEEEVHLLTGVEGREQRIALAATVKWREKKILMISAHLDHAKEDLRQSQAKDVVAIAGRSADVEILAGDMNAPWRSGTLDELRKRWKFPDYDKAFPTFSSKTKDSQIDFIFVNSQSDLSVKHIQAIESDASDHLPLLLEVK